MRLFAISLFILCTLAAIGTQNAEAQAAPPNKFDIVEATIADIQNAILARQITTTDVVNAYLTRIKAYNGTCVNQPQGLLGPVTPIEGVRSINALITLNLRPAVRERWGFDPRKARSMTDPLDNNPDLPDALETAAAFDAKFAATGTLVGPLHGVVMSVKDVLDTADMRTTSGADADYANDRPPTDSTVVKRLRDAGAIILAKSNLGEYASGSRSSFGGTLCNPYDTMRDPGGSSGGSAASVAANLVTCGISEEGAPSIRMPSRLNNVYGLSPSQGLVSRDGMIGAGTLNDRVGAACRTALDEARIFDVIAGYDKADDLTVYSVGRMPKEGYTSFAKARDLKGLTIGVVREYMDKDLFTIADSETIDVVNTAIDDLRKLGATIVDPGPHGALFQACLAQYVPQNFTGQYIRQNPSQFPAGSDQVLKLDDLFAHPAEVSGKATIRNFGPVGSDAGEARYYFNRYLQKRKDANIQSLTDLINKSHFYVDEFGRDTRFRDVKSTLQGFDQDKTIDLETRNANRLAIQQTVMACMKAMNLDAVVYPTGNIPATLIKGIVEPDVNGRSHQAWTLLGQMGFPAMTVPAGFTTQAFDRVRDPAAPGGSKLTGPVAARLPVGMDILTYPFGESTLFTIASAYEAATHHREPPPDFGPVETTGR